MSKIKSYISSFRLRTLPLALSSILMANFIAAYNDEFIWSVGVWAVITTILLQILSNVANDYGDAMSGADNEERVGPDRMVAKGNISPLEMRNTVIVFSILALAAGLYLISLGNFATLGIKAWSLFVIGIGAIAAAIKYTVGKNPYGYKGMGDLFVFLFFGLAGVLGTYFLHTGSLSLWIILPASAVGFLSSGVLNLNNLRDIVSDGKTGKHTLIVKKGSAWGKKYHAFLLITSLVCMVIYGALQFVSPWQWLFLLPYILIFKSLIFVLNNQEPVLLDPHLKKLAISTFLMVLLFGVGLLF